MPRSRLGSFVPAGIALLAVAALAPAQVASYHDVTSATHQAQFTALSNAGYRLVSLSVAGGLSAPRYSAVWEQVSGPGWVASHDMSSAQYSVTRANWINQGFRAKLITAAGSGSNVVYAAVFVADGQTVTDFQAYTEASFLSAMDSQRTAGRIPVCVDIHGTSTTPLYSAVFEPNPSDKVWGFDIDATGADFTDTRDAHDEGGERLAAIGMSDSQRYVSVWYDDRVGNEVVRNDQTFAGWQATYNSWTSSGHHHRLIASGGTGANTRFAGSFATSRVPLIRTMTTTGVYRSQFAACDTFMQNLLQSQAARAGAMAIARDGKLVYARAFTWAEGGYPITQPTDAFRIASCTKPMNAIATHQLDEMGLVTMTTRPQAVLGLPYYSQSFDDIEVHDVLEYTSGVVRNYDPWTIANWANPTSPVLPVGITLGSQWLADQAMLFMPSTYYKYSNAAWMLTAEVIRVRSGLPYTTFVQNEVFAPLGITRIRVAPSEYGQLTAADVLHHLNVLDLDASELHTDRRRKSAQYAQDLSFKRASGGMASSAVDYVRFLSGVFDLRGSDAVVLNSATLDDVLERHTYVKFDTPSENQQICLAGMSWETRAGGVHAYNKGGSLENASSVVSWRDDGISWAVFINKGDSGASADSVHDLIENVTSWPNVDEFPSYGLPAFPQRAALTSISPSSLPNMTQTGTFTLTGKRMDTVTSVRMGLYNISSTSPTSWATGWFELLSPTQIRVHPRQGMDPQTLSVWVVNPIGSSNSVSFTYTPALSFRVGAPTVVNPGQTWSAYVSRGTLTGISPSTFVVLGLSFSNQPSSAPGVVDLGIGNQFADLLTTGAVLFDATSSLAHFALPAVPSGSVYVQAVALDLAAPSLFPLPASNVAQITRL